MQFLETFLVSVIFVESTTFTTARVALATFSNRKLFVVILGRLKIKTSCTSETDTLTVADGNGRPARILTSQGARQRIPSARAARETRWAHPWDHSGGTPTAAHPVSTKRHRVTLATSLPLAPHWTHKWTLFSCMYYIELRVKCCLEW